MSGYMKDEDVEEDLFDHYLVKPVNPEEVLHLLAHIDRSGEWRVASGEMGWRIAPPMVPWQVASGGGGGEKG